MKEVIMKKEIVEKIELEDRCPNCGSTNTVPENGETICRSCGLVISERNIDLRPEWQAFTPEENISRSRIGSPPTHTLPDKGLSTIISYFSKDALGKQLSPATRRKMGHLSKLQKQSNVHGNLERNISKAMAILSQFELPRYVKETAAIYYQKVVLERIARGRTIKALVAACIFAACRKTGYPVSFHEISREYNVSIKLIGNCFKQIVRKLNLKMPDADDDAFKYIPIISAKLDIYQPSQILAAKLLERLKQTGFNCGKNPQGVAGAILYTVCLGTFDSRTQREIAEAAGVSEATIRTHSKNLRKLMLP